LAPHSHEIVAASWTSISCSFCSDRNRTVDARDFLGSDGPEKPCLQEVADEGVSADLVA
jgi:hypothetical protein